MLRRFPKLLSVRFCGVTKRKLHKIFGSRKIVNGVDTLEIACRGTRLSVTLTSGLNLALTKLELGVRRIIFSTRHNHLVDASGGYPITALLLDYFS